MMAPWLSLIRGWHRHDREHGQPRCILRLSDYQIAHPTQLTMGTCILPSAVHPTARATPAFATTIARLCSRQSDQCWRAIPISIRVVGSDSRFPCQKSRMQHPGAQAVQLSSECRSLALALPLRRWTAWAYGGMLLILGHMASARLCADLAS